MTGRGPETTAGGARPFDGCIRDAGLRGAVAYWDALRGGRAVPPRLELDPTAFRPHLQNAAILEIPRPGAVRVRLAGAAISRLLGMEVRGLPLRALFDLSDRARIADLAERALGAPEAVLMDVVAPAPRFGRPRAESLQGQIAILPMTDANLEVTRALYVMSTPDGPPGAATPPLRWCMTHHRAVSLVPGQPVLAAEPLRHAPRHAPVGAMDEDESERRGPLARARFRVIDGGLS